MKKTKPITKAQRKFLEDQKVKVPSDATSMWAAYEITKIVERKRPGGPLLSGALKYNGKKRQKFYDQA